VITGLLLRNETIGRHNAESAVSTPIPILAASNSRLSKVDVFGDDPAPYIWAPGSSDHAQPSVCVDHVGVCILPPSIYSKYSVHWRFHRILLFFGAFMILCLWRSPALFMLALIAWRIWTAWESEERRWWIEQSHTKLISTRDNTVPASNP
jgi:hypothetical protein